jgi:hypothetical protein
MTLRSQLATDAVSVFCNADDFAESVTYYPHRYYGDASRAARTINAVVVRESITVLGEDGDTVLPVWEIHVANSSTSGISSEELDLGGDQISLPPRDGETAARKTIVRLTSHDPGMLVLECR